MAHIDGCFPAQTHILGRQMRTTSFMLRDIDFMMVTHFHVDLAGAIQELKDEGIKLILFDVQQDFIAPMEALAGNKWPYKKLLRDDNNDMKVSESRQFLQKCGISGEVIHTPGHTPDSVSLLLDTGEVFIGDMRAENLIMEDSTSEKHNWQKLKSKGAKFVFPGHGVPYPIHN